MAIYSRRKLLKLGTIIATASLAGLMNHTFAKAYPIEEKEPPLKPHYYYDKKWRLSIGLAPSPNTMGRIFGYALIKDRPSIYAQNVGDYAWNEVVPIYGQVESSESPWNYNKIWYRTDKGFVHSAQMHPCEDVENEPMTSIPNDGFWAELTVPSAFARLRPNPDLWGAYTYYYGCTFKVMGADQDKQGRWWYQIDDELKGKFFVRSEFLRPIDPIETTPLSPNVALSDKKIEIDLSKQFVTAYEYNQPVYRARCATGTKFKKPDGTLKDFETTPGLHRVSHKMLSQHMEGGTKEEGDYYDLPGVAWVSYFTGSGIAFHAAYWHNDFGAPRSHGCVNLLPQDAKWIFRWTLPTAKLDRRVTLVKNYTDGTLVRVFYS
jgi:hypothetical protein